MTLPRRSLEGLIWEVGSPSAFRLDPNPITGAQIFLLYEPNSVFGPEKPWVLSIQKNGKSVETSFRSRAEAGEWLRERLPR